MYWYALPDIVAIGLLILVFLSVSHYHRRPETAIWLGGWLMIFLHFIASLFKHLPGHQSQAAYILLSASLTWAGLLFIYSEITFRATPSSRWMLATQLTTNTLYVTVHCLQFESHWPLNLAAALLGLAPCTILLVFLRQVNHPLRWIVCSLYLALSTVLLNYQFRPNYGFAISWNAVNFTVYFSCCIVFWYTYRRSWAGAMVTVSGFFLWSMVFVLSPLAHFYRPQLQIENEVWNLPKYLVACGMILLLVEEQISYSRHLALHDVLTGLPNRRLFEDRMAQAIERSRRSGAHISLLVLDLDGFKQVNDTHGHHVGDLLLQRVATLFCERVRRSDTVARTGGDEFCILLEEPCSKEQAQSVAHSLNTLLLLPQQIQKRQINIRASIGVATFPDDVVSAERLCIVADQRMYEAKNRNRPAPEASVVARTKLAAKATKSEEKITT